MTFDCPDNKVDAWYVPIESHGTLVVDRRTVRKDLSLGLSGEEPAMAPAGLAGPEPAAPGLTPEPAIAPIGSLGPPDLSKPTITPLGFSTLGEHLAAKKISGLEYLLNKVRVLGDQVHDWAQAMLHARGIEDTRHCMLDESHRLLL
jgi:hypothetical protein